MFHKTIFCFKNAQLLVATYLVIKEFDVIVQVLNSMNTESDNHLKFQSFVFYLQMFDLIVFIAIFYEQIIVTN